MDLGQNVFGLETETSFLEHLKEKDVWDVIYYPSVNSFQGREEH